MKLDLFDYHLPQERIAQAAAEPRDSARLLVHQRESNQTEHAQVHQLPQLLKAGDLLVLNDTRVIPARLFAHRASGGAVEALLLEAANEESNDEPGGQRWCLRWRSMLRPSRRIKPGELLQLADESCALRVHERCQDESGAWWVEFEAQPAAKSPLDLMTLLESIGNLPLPPYIERSQSAAGKDEPEDPRNAADRERYQTVYANKPGAVAAPTAGLHFTEALFAQLDQAGIERTTVTLHVGEGTFRPVAVENIEEHPMHSERYHLSQQAVEAIAACKARGGRVVAVGTTSVRVLESCATQDGSLQAGSGRTNIFLRPGSKFQVVDALLTNFHLPKSTLLMLVSAFANRERILKLYQEAIDQHYRFYSYGDAMLLL